MNTSGKTLSTPKGVHGASIEVPVGNFGRRKLFAMLHFHCKKASLRGRNATFLQ